MADVQGTCVDNSMSVGSWNSYAYATNGMKEP